MEMLQTIEMKKVKLSKLRYKHYILSATKLLILIEAYSQC